MSDVAFVQAPTLVAGTTFVATGLSLGSSFPTMTSVNADYTHFNQVVALYNRRTNQVMATPDPMPYFNASKINATDVNTLRTKINTLRNAAGYSSTAFGASVAAGDKILASHLNTMAASLPVGLSTIPITGSIVRMIKTDSPYNTNTIAPVSSGLSNGAGAGAFLGKVTLVSGAKVQRARMGVRFLFGFPFALASTCIATLHIGFDAWSNTLESFVPAVYCGPTTPATSGTWYNDDLAAPIGSGTFLGSGTYGLSGDQAIPLSISGLNTISSGTLNCVIGENSELTNAGLGYNGSTGQKAGFSWNSSLSITLDFGF